MIAVNIKFVGSFGGFGIHLKQRLEPLIKLLSCEINPFEVNEAVEFVEVELVRELILTLWYAVVVN